MLETYVPVFMAFITAILLAAFLLGLGSVLGPRKPSKVKGEPFECGIPSKGTLGERYSVGFFLVALIFLIFDVEVVFLFPWASVFREFVDNGHGYYILGTMGVFLFFLILGLFYDWKKGGLKWE